MLLLRGNRVIKKILATTAALGLVASPIAAQAATAARDASPVNKSERLEGENGILIAVLAAAAVIAGIIIIADDDDPESP